METLEEYIKANQPKGRYSKKYLKEHNRALYTAWYNIYIHMPNATLAKAKNILNNNI